MSMVLFGDILFFGIRIDIPQCTTKVQTRSRNHDVARSGMDGEFNESKLANYGHAIRVWGGHVWVGGAEPTVWEWWGEARLNCPTRDNLAGACYSAGLVGMVKPLFLPQLNRASPLGPVGESVEAQR